MEDCKSCNLGINQGELMQCKHCGATFCNNCAKKTKNICPYCYSDLELKG